MKPSPVGSTSGTSNTEIGPNSDIKPHDHRAITQRATALAERLSGKTDLTSVLGVANLMASSKTEVEWAINAEAVLIANRGNYPRFWGPQILLSGLLDETAAKFR